MTETPQPDPQSAANPEEGSRPVVTAPSSRPAVTAPSKKKGGGLFSEARFRYGVGALAVISIALVAVTWLTLAYLKQPASILGIVIAPLTTMITAYFGIQAAADGKAGAEQNAAQAQAAALSAHKDAIAVALSTPEVDPSRVRAVRQTLM